MEREKSQKKPNLGKMGYQLGTTALISIDNYNAFRISRIMLILGKFKNELLNFYQAKLTPKLLLDES